MRAFRRKASAPPPEPDPATLPVVTLYRRPGCPLCDQAEAVMAPLARRIRFRVEAVDIEQDDALLKRYVFEIPVVAYEGRDVAAWPFTAERLEDALGPLLA